MRRWLEKLRFPPAVMLIVASCLPISTCMRYASTTEQQVTAPDGSEQDPVRFKATDYRDAYGSGEPSSLDRVMVWAIFAGPQAFVILFATVSHRAWRLAFRFPGAPGLAFSAFAVPMIVTFGIGFGT